MTTEGRSFDVCLIAHVGFPVEACRSKRNLFCNSEPVPLGGYQGFNNSWLHPIELPFEFLSQSCTVGERPDGRATMPIVKNNFRLGMASLEAVDAGLRAGIFCRIGPAGAPTLPIFSGGVLKNGQ